MKLREQVYIASKWKILITVEIKQSIKQLLQRKLILHDHLLKLNTERSV